MQDTNNSKKRRNHTVIFSIRDNDEDRDLVEIRTRKWKFLTSILFFLLLYTSGILALVYYTPLKKTIPGYPDIDPQIMFQQNKSIHDSIMTEILAWDIYLKNIEKIMNGEPVHSTEQIVRMQDSIKIAESSDFRSAEDSILRSQVLEISNQQKPITDISIQSMFCPIKGIVTARYNLANDHPYIDIAADEGTNVFSVLPGTIISDEFSDKYGYSLQIQHEGDLVSVYRHIDRLIKRRGEKVEAGTAIATIGRKGGSLSDGPHLHFELWYKGEPINPELYINFY